MHQDIAMQWHHSFIEELRRAHGCFTSEELFNSFNAVPRHFFLPTCTLDEVYSDKAIMTATTNGRGRSSCSQPSFIALMANQVGAGSGKRILEIGSGTGYTAAILSRLVGSSGVVVSVDLDDDLVEMTCRNLVEFGFQAESKDGTTWFTKPGFGNISVRCQDGCLPVPVCDLYDGIVVTASGTDIAESWMSQLAERGRLIVPIRLLPGLQLFIAFEKTDNQLVSFDIRPCSAVPLRGEVGGDLTDWSKYRISLEPSTGSGTSHLAAVFQRRFSRLAVEPVTD